MSLTYLLIAFGLFASAALMLFFADKLKGE